MRPTNLGAEKLAAGGQLPIGPDRRLVVRAAPGFGQHQRFQRVPQVGNRGFRRIIAYRPDPETRLGRGGPESRPRPVSRRKAHGLCGSQR
jgi:hypothetical protein